MIPETDCWTGLGRFSNHLEESAMAHRCEPALCPDNKINVKHFCFSSHPHHLGENGKHTTIVEYLHGLNIYLTAKFSS